MLPVILTIVLAYLIGAIPFGFLIARMHGLDIRAAGSGNIGATNVGRLLGKKAGALVFVLDFTKGAIPVGAAIVLHLNDWLPVAVGLAAFLGHVFPVWLGFRGGKGVATGAGVVAVLLPLPTVAGLLVWLAVFCSTRYMSLASILGAAALAGLRFVLVQRPFDAEQRILTAFTLLAFGLVLLRHWGNLSRLLQGTESQFPESPAMNAITRILHVLSLGLWFGGSVFFTFVAAVLIFATLNDIGKTPPAERPAWLPLAASFDEESSSCLAGATVAPMFPVYFILQGACGLLALITANGFTRSEPSRRVHRIRFWILTLALLTVIASWPLNEKVGELRLLRNTGDSAAKASFGGWHGASLLLSFATIGLVTAGMALAAWMPAAKCEMANSKSEIEK